MSNLLVDITDLCITECVLVEDKYGGPTVLEGVLQRSDVKNANGRIYPRSLWERTLAEGSPVMKKVQERGMMGHLEHPKDGVFLLGSHEGIGERYGFFRVRTLVHVRVS